MKQFLLALFVSFSVITGILAFAPQTYKAYAKETIELNFGEVAKDKDVVGTANYEPDDGEAGFGALIEQILTIVVTIAAIIIFIMFLWGGLEWITAGGDKTKIEKARTRIMQSIIGMIVLAGVIALFGMLQAFLNFEVIQFSATGGGGGACTVTGELENDGVGFYCTQGATIVKCFPPAGNYKQTTTTHVIVLWAHSTKSPDTTSILVDKYG